MRNESRATLKNAINEHFGEITVSEDGDIKYSKTPFADPAAESMENEEAESEEEEEEEDEEIEDDMYEDENALIVVETTDMSGKKVKAAPARGIQHIISTTDEDEDSEEQHDAEDEDEDELEEESSEDEETAVARSNRMLELMRQMGADMSDLEEAAESESESEEEVAPVPVKKTAKKAPKAEPAAVKAPKVDTKASKSEKTQKMNVEKPVKAAKKAAVEEPMEPKAMESKKRPAEAEPKLTKAEAKKARKPSSVASEKALYQKLLEAEDDSVKILDNAAPTLTEAALLSLPRPVHWEAEKYRKQAMAEAETLDKERPHEKNATPKDHLAVLAQDDTYGWEEGETSREKSFGAINGMPPACMGGRHRKKPLSKKKDNSHNARKERQRQREKAEEDKRAKDAFEGGQSMSAHGFGYNSDDDDEDLMMMGKNNKKRKVIEARQRSMKKAMDRQSDAEKPFVRGSRPVRGRGVSRGSYRGAETATRKSYFFGSKDGAVNL
jgi:hypothetical protein